MVRTMGTWTLAPSVTQLSTVHGSQITNLDSFVHKVVPYKQTHWEIIENPLVNYNSKLFSALRVLFQVLKIMIYKWKSKISLW